MTGAGVGDGTGAWKHFSNPKVSCACVDTGVTGAGVGDGTGAWIEAFQ